MLQQEKQELLQGKINEALEILMRAQETLRAMEQDSQKDEKDE